ncbi:MAG: hypothetical protein ABF649_13470 [Bacillus sp. (in: firmicutes)]
MNRKAQAPYSDPKKNVHMTQKVLFTFRSMGQYSQGLGARARQPSHFKKYILFHLLKNKPPILLFLNRVISKLANEFDGAKFELILLFQQKTCLFQNRLSILKQACL